MKTEQAIKLLHRLQDEQFDGIHGDERREALEIAVRALEQNLVQESGGLVQDLVKDCISRKMAIDAFEPEHDTDWYTPRIIEVLEALPPVQPTQTNADSTHENTLDCVSRQAVIDIVRNRVKRFTTACVLAVTEIEQLPSAQPERKKGKWIWWYEESFTEHATEYTPHCKCSECGRECAPSVATYSNFCRNCGADMRGENDE